MNHAAWRKAIYDWAAANGPQPIWADQNAPRPARPYTVLRLSPSVPVGHDSEGEPEIELVPVPGAGGFEEPVEGSIGISSIEELQMIGNDPAYPIDGDYHLTQDIDASGTVDWNDGAGFAPIAQFQGKFRGLGKAIHNLTVKRTTGSVGLFTRVQGPTTDHISISDLRMEDCNISATEGSAGMLCERVVTSKVRRCSLSGTVTGGTAVGGITQGIQEQGTMEECSFTGVVIGGVESGGICRAIDPGCLILNSYAVGEVFSLDSSGNPVVGGAGGVREFSQGNLVRSYAAAKINDPFGGLVRNNASGTGVEASFWDVDVSEAPLSIGGGTPLTTAQAKTKATYEAAGWDFDTVWDINPAINNGYPFLRWFGGFTKTIDRELTGDREITLTVQVFGNDGYDTLAKLEEMLFGLNKIINRATLNQAGVVVADILGITDLGQLRSPEFENRAQADILLRVKATAREELSIIENADLTGDTTPGPGITLEVRT